MWKNDTAMYIVADIGGTKMRIAGAATFDRFQDPVVLDTPQSYAEGLAVFTATATKIAQGNPVDKVVAGVPAVLFDKRRIVTAPHLPDWDGHNFADDIERELSTEAILENDTALVGLGEAAFGAGAGAPIVAYITVSTGVNGARFVDGVLDRSARGFEIGGQYLSMDPMLTLEDMVSGSAVHKHFGVHPRELGKDSPVWEELSRTFAFGLHTTVLHWSPDRVVLGGSMFNPIGIPVERVKFHLADIMRKFSEIPEIVHSSLGDLGGLYGGLAMIKQSA